MQSKVAAKLEAHGITGLSKEWVLKALDPACTAVSEGLPDASAFSVLRPEYRVQQIVNFTVAVGPSATWDLFMYTPPGDVNGLIWAAAPSPADFTATAPPPGSESGYIQLQAPMDLPGATAWQQTYPVYHAVNSGVRVAANQPYAFRHQYKGITVELVAPAVADQGSIYAGQFQPLVGYGNIFDTTTINLAAGGIHNAARLAPVRIPLNEDQLTRMSVGFYEGDARDGCYVPHRLCGPSQPFAYPTGMAPTFSSLYAGASGIFTAAQDVSTIAFPSCMVPNQNWTGEPVAFGATPNPLSWVSTGIISSITGIPGTIQGYDTGYDNCNVAVVIMRGLAAAQSGGSFGASVRVTVRAGFEVVPSPQSADRIFAEPAAPFHPRALEAYYGISLEMKDAFPASYNSLGSIFDLIEKVASTLWKPVRAIGEGVTSLVGLGGARRLPVTPAKGGLALKAALKARRTPSVGSVRSVKSGMGGVRLKSQRRRKRIAEKK